MDTNIILSLDLTPMMINTTPAWKITILQWNTYGLKSKLPTFSLALAEESHDVSLLSSHL